MIIPKLALRSLDRNRKSTLVLVGLVTVGVLLYLLGDAVLGVAASGIREEFRNGYTGDVAVRARFERKFGVFGFSVPTIGEYEEIPTLEQASRIRTLIGSTSGIESGSGLVSGAALLQGPNGSQLKVPVFGVDAPGYFSLFPSVRFVAGGLPEGPGAWIVLPESRAEELARAEARPLAIGDSLQFTMASGSAFTIRAVRLAGIVETPMRGSTEYAPVYTDPLTLRSLLGLGTGAADTASAAAVVDEGLDIADFFSAELPSEAAAPESAVSGLELVSSYLETGPAAVEPPSLDPDAGAWHFFLARLESGVSTAGVVRKLNAVLRDEGIQAEAVGWLDVAGLNAGILFLLKTVFEIGIGVLAAIVVLVLTNGLAFSVIEQTREIATMRAIGAQKAFVSRLYLLQSILIVLSGTVLGMASAWLILKGLAQTGIPISNSYLLMLFGSPLLRPTLLAGAMFLALAGSLVVASVASIYPVGLAMRMSQAQTMSAE